MIRKVLIAGILLLLAAQLIRPARDLPAEAPADTLYATLDVPPDVRDLLEASCIDCHSHRVEWPWYSQVAPASWICARDVKNGLRSLNLSTWGTQSKYRMAKKLESLRSEVEDGRMPLPRHTWLHPGARLSDADRARLVEWARGEEEKIVARLNEDPEAP